MDSQGNKVYKKPSELLNFWMTTQVDMQNFSSWCYKTSPATVEARMQQLVEEARTP